MQTPLLGDVPELELKGMFWIHKDPVCGCVWLCVYYCAVKHYMTIRTDPWLLCSTYAKEFDMKLCIVG